jgi:hypothetical protein
MAAGLGITHEVDVEYSNPSMTCEQLRAAWLSTLAKAHRVVTNDSTSTQLFVKDPTFTISIGIDTPALGDCTRPTVSAQNLDT